VVVTRIVQGQDVWVLEVGGGLDLLYEPLAPQHGAAAGGVCDEGWCGV